MAALYTQIAATQISTRATVAAAMEPGQLLTQGADALLDAGAVLSTLADQASDETPAAGAVKAHWEALADEMAAQAGDLMNAIETRRIGRCSN